jgi:hypothetical protein
LVLKNTLVTGCSQRAVLNGFHAYGKNFAPMEKVAVRRRKLEPTWVLYKMPSGANPKITSYEVLKI